MRQAAKAVAGAALLFLLVVLASAPSTAAARGTTTCPRIQRTAAGIWEPTATTAPWQWQLQGKIDTGVAACFFDVDGFETPRATVAALHRSGRIAICYLDVGSWERYRPDAKRFPRSVCGSYKPFVAAGKAVFEAEYELEPSDYCDAAKSLDFSAIRKSYDLFAQPWEPC